MSTSERRPAPVIDDGLVGRRRELDALSVRLDQARVGAGRLVFCVGEPGIGKSRLAQELAGLALAKGIAVSWGRCHEGAPPLWPWRQVLGALGRDPETVRRADSESPDERFRVFEAVRDSLLAAAHTALVVVLDDVHWADEPSLLVLRHVADQLAASRLLIFAALRDGALADARPRVLADLMRWPGTDRFDLPRFDAAEVQQMLSQLMITGREMDPAAILDVTAGNPLFVREVARSIVDGTWRPDRPPRTVLDIVRGRLDRASPECRRLLQAAAIVGRDFSLAVVAAVLDEPVAACLEPVDEATAHGLVLRVDDIGGYRFVHALTRDAVEAALTSAERVDLHHAAAEALAAQFAHDLSEHVADIARHWAFLAPFGDGATARYWTIRAADEAVRRLDYPDAVAKYNAALALDPASLADDERCLTLVSLGRAARLAGDVEACSAAAVAAASAARSGAPEAPELLSEAALILEASPDPGVNAVAKQLCDEALTRLGPVGHDALRARLLAQRSHLAFYDGDYDRVESLSAAAVAAARQTPDDRALVDALHARKEAYPEPTGRADRIAIADEMLAVAQRTNIARTALWGRLWRIEALMEGGQLAAAAEELPALQISVARMGGPVTAWQADRVAACVAQAQGRIAEAAMLGRRAFDRMRPVEPIPAAGTYFALQCALTCHIQVSDEAAAFARGDFEAPPRFRTMARISRAFVLLRMGLVDEAAASYQRAGPVDGWSLPAFFTIPGRVYGAMVATGLGRAEDLVVLLDQLRPFRAEHVSGEGVSYLGPVALALGRGAAALGRLDVAVGDLTAGAEQAARAGAAGFLAEANYWLATTLVARNRPGDHDRARAAAVDADRLARSLGMTAYVDRTGALVNQLRAGRHGRLTARETDIAKLVGQGLTNRQIAKRLVISERTAENHVQHILAKLGFTTRSQIAAWSVTAYK